MLKQQTYSINNQTKTKNFLNNSYLSSFLIKLNKLFNNKYKANNQNKFLFNDIETPSTSLIAPMCSKEFNDKIKSPSLLNKNLINNSKKLNNNSYKLKLNDLTKIKKTKQFCLLTKKKSSKLLNCHKFLNNKFYKIKKTNEYSFLPLLNDQNQFVSFFYNFLNYLKIKIVSKYLLINL